VHFRSFAENHIDALFDGRFHLFKVQNIPPEKLCSVLSREVPVLTKVRHHAEMFVLTSRSKTTHIASFSSSNSCFTAFQQPKSHSQLSLLPYSTTTLFCMRAATADLLSSL